MHYSKDLHYTGDRWSGYERLKVDSAQTGFFEGREFRTFIEFSIAAGASLVCRFTAPTPFILFGQRLLVDDGKIRLAAKDASGVAGGSWTARPIIGKNRMPERRFPYYVAQCTADSGGTYTGGVDLEVVRVATAGATGQAATVGGSIGEERGLPAGTYYLVLTNYGSGTATGTYDLWWEERATHPSWKRDESKTS